MYQCRPVVDTLNTKYDTESTISNALLQKKLCCAICYVLFSLYYW